MGSDESQWIAYVGPFEFPQSAAGRRVLGISRALADCGFNVCVLSGSVGVGRAEDDRPEGATARHVAFGRSRSTTGFSRIMELFAMAMRSRRWIQRQRARPRAIVLYSGYLPYLLCFMRWARRRNIAVIFDAVEWYAAATPLRMLLSPYHWSIEVAIRVLMTRLDGIISISTAFTRYFQRKAVPVLQVPPTLATKDVPQDEHSVSRPLELVYAGNPGSKDLLATVVEAVTRMDTSGADIRLHIAGPSEEQIRTFPSMEPWLGRDLPSSIICHGTLSHSEVLSLVHRASFSVLVRPWDRVSRYGFATKFVESFAVGTPVIGNRTGDLSQYLKDGKTGFVCNGTDAGSLMNAMHRAREVDAPAYLTMRMSARRTAEESFESENYSQSLADFIGALNTNSSVRTK